MKAEKKVEVELEDLKELSFDTRPSEITERLNEGKCRLLDYLKINIAMVIEGRVIYIQGNQEILDSMKHKIGTLAIDPVGWAEIPSSLKSFEIAVLVGDRIQKDTRKNKNEYHLRTTTIDDKVAWQWVNTQDMMLIDQKRKELDLVEMVDKKHLLKRITKQWRKVMMELITMRRPMMVKWVNIDG